MGKVQIFPAIYSNTHIPDYDGNPLIEALPPILDSEEAIRKLAHYPKYEKIFRFQPNHIRYHLIRNCMKFFAILNVHIDLERRFSCMIRTGYQGRNISKGNFNLRVGRLAKSIISDSIVSYTNNSEDYFSTTAYGFNIVGTSGIGKTQSVLRILKTYPQVIYHNNYKGMELNELQLVWMKLDCPFDASLKGLCINFFQNVDAVLNTNYEKNYSSGRRTTDEMLPQMFRVAANHHLGVLVIDEVQRLSAASSGGADKMLNFFVQLVNTIGIPVVLIGTLKALNTFDGNFSQLRRGTGQGDLIWKQMKFDDQWEEIIERLWEYQFTRDFCILDKKFSKVLFEETQGITDLLIKAFMFAQERAIETGIEKINESIIRSVCLDKFQMLRPALDALKSKDVRALEKYEDAYSRVIKNYGYLSSNTPISRNDKTTSNFTESEELSTQNQLKKISEKPINKRQIKKQSRRKRENKVFLSQIAESVEESLKNNVELNPITEDVLYNTFNELGLIRSVDNISSSKAPFEDNLEC